MVRSQALEGLRGKDRDDDGKEGSLSEGVSWID